MEHTSPHRRHRRLTTAAGLVALFLLAALVRVYQPQSRPFQWLTRARAFMDAVEEGDWAATYQQYHPGVTTMAIAGSGIFLAEKFPEQTKQVLRWAAPPTITEYGWRMLWGAMAIGLVIAALITAICGVLLGLSDVRTAFGAGIFMALSPFYLSQSRVLHVDGLLSAFMLLSALLLLLYARDRHPWALIASGAAGGLALLTKSPGLYLVPYAGLVLATPLLIPLREGWADHSQGRVRWLLELTLRRAAIPFAGWLFMVAAMFALWPAMWVDPLGSLRGIAEAIFFQATTPHHNPRFFAGQIVQPDAPPSALFYPLTIAYQLTAMTLVLALLSLAFYTIWRRRVHPSLSADTYWLLVAYIGFYLLQMLVSAKQDQRYIVPADLAIQLLAAAGLSGMMTVAERASGRRLAQVVFAGVIAFQVAVVAVIAPNYGAHRNHLLGGNLVARNLIEVTGDQNEGVQYVAAYLADAAPEARVYQTPKVKLTMDQYLPAEQMISQQQTESQIAEFMLFDTLSLQRHLYGDTWADTFKDFQARPPQLLVLFDGVEHYRLVATDPASTLPTTVVRRGWNGLIVVAWLLTAGLIALPVWGLPRLNPAAEPPAAEPPVQSEVV